MTTSIVVCVLLVNSVFCLNCVKKLDVSTDYEDLATEVNISATIENMYFINTVNMEVEVTLMLHQRWFDSSLGNNVKTQEKAVSGQIWRPKITTTKGCLKTCTNSEDTQFWRGFGKGNVLLSEKMVVKTTCTKNFHRYPFDTQVCELKFSSYLFPIEELKLHWEDHSIDLQSSTDLNGFQIINVATLMELDIRASGNFNALALQIFVKRHFLSYVVSLVAICVLLVLLSYGSFWIDHERIAFRLSLCLSSLLFLMYFYVMFSVQISNASVITALDWFFVLNLIFIAFALFENGSISRLLSYRYTKIIDKNKLLSYKTMVKYIEYGCRVFYPILYVVCLVLYTLKYFTDF